MIEIAYFIFTVCLYTSIVCSLVRIWKGPTVADRINAADVVALCGIGLALGHGWMRGDALWLDVAMVAGLVLFVGTSAVSLFLDPKHLSSKEND
ncbi:MAG: monovalent cation/H+ antiporter complex subunit F [Verrucomicrobiales bacterium]|jgi:multisubunit Na+/H+ antiporter MnhF subunit|nr:monovalent cation/H+ antiporter complex subunit F [Verrucomicrobiales bacterium]